MHPECAVCGRPAHYNDGTRCSRHQNCFMPYAAKAHDTYQAEADAIGVTREEAKKRMFWDLYANSPDPRRSTSKRLGSALCPGSDLPAANVISSPGPTEERPWNTGTCQECYRPIPLRSAGNFEVIKHFKLGYKP